MVVKVTSVDDKIDAGEFLRLAGDATSIASIEKLLARLPIVPASEYTYDDDAPERGWREGSLHWLPVGLSLSNASHIKLGPHPENRMAERIINMMEAILELLRRRELLAMPKAPPPATPREAVQRYLNLPSPEQIPVFDGPGGSKDAHKRAREWAHKIRVRLVNVPVPTSRKGDYTMIFEDDGIGQAPENLHKTILSLGSSDKPDKPYLIGMFGHGGSSNFAASLYSWIISRRASELRDGSDNVGWTVVKKVIRPSNRLPYYAYLAAHPDGRVASVPAQASSAINLEHGTRIAHIKYDVGNLDSVTLYQALQHLLFNPVLPFALNTKGDRRWDLCFGNAYRLTNLRVDGDLALDKTIPALPVERKETK